MRTLKFIVNAQKLEKDPSCDPGAKALEEVEKLKAAIERGLTV